MTEPLDYSILADLEVIALLHEMKQKTPDDLVQIRALQAELRKREQRLT